MGVSVNQPSKLISSLISTATIAAAGLVGVFLGAWLNGRRERIQRRYDFVARQLRDFYSPMLGLRREVRMRSELREKVREGARAAWNELSAAARREGTPEALQRLTRERGPDFTKIIDYDNQQLTNELMPAYRSMVKVFRDNYWLAESDTRAYFQTLIEFVELWDRFIADALPREVLTGLSHGEHLLTPFYDHLEAKHDDLRSRLARGVA